jgi:hypothetical protein
MQRNTISTATSVVAGDSFDRQPNHGDLPVKPGIVTILPRGETFRNFIYTGALDFLDRESDLTVLSIFPNADFERMLSSRYERVLPLSGAKDRWQVRFLREILDMAHGRWLWSGAARERWRIRDAEANTPLKWLKRQGKKLACYPFSNSPGLERLSKLERTMSRKYRSTDEYLRLYRRLRPRLVFNASHVHSVIATQAVEAAQWLGIPTATFLFSWDNLTSQGRIMLPYDYYLVWNESIREQLLSIYPAIRSEQIFVTGTPQFDTHFQEEYYWSREEFCERTGADPSRPIVFYSTGMAYQMPGEPQIVERLAEMLREMPLPVRPQLMVRVYPKDRTNRFDDLKKRAKDILFPEVPWEKAWLTPKEEDAYLLVNSLRHAAVGINIASTISLELCMFDKPVINVGYNPPGIDTGPVNIPSYYAYDHYRPIVESGAVAVAWSESELRDQLLRALSDPLAAARERRQLIQSMFGDTLDGQSWHRVVSRLLEFAQQ